MSNKLITFNRFTYSKLCGTFIVLNEVKKTMSKYYLTTAIDYVNGKPHIGHAYEKIMTDVVARHARQVYDDVWFLTGTDEHGIKIQKTAAAQGCKPIEICDENSKSFADTWDLLDVSYDDFIRTTQERHKKVVQKTSLYFHI